MTLLKIMHQTGMPILTIFGCKIYFLTLNFLKNNNFVNIPQYHQMQYNHTWLLTNFIYRYPNQETEVTGIQMPNRTHITPRLSHSYDDMSFVTGESNKLSIFSQRCLRKERRKQAFANQNYEDFWKDGLNLFNKS